MALITGVLFCAVSLCFGLGAEAFTFNRSLQNNRIVGGSDANINEIPYQISLLHYGRHRCGGVILNRYFVLTAAHCFMEVYDINKVQIRVGSSKSNSGGLIYGLDFYTLHPDYPEDHQDTTDYDVAIIKLAYPLKFDRNIQPATLAEEGYEPGAEAKAIVSGWGRLEYEGDMPINLQKVEVEIIDSFDCYLTYTGLHEISERQICAGSPKGGKDACTADSGGPLTINGVVVGLVSWGEECGQEEYPGVYSNVAQYRDWIDEILRVEGK